MGFGGIFFNLVLYLIRVWGVAPADAANDMTNLLGTMFFTSLLGGLLGDAYIGRLWTVVVFLVIYVLVSDNVFLSKSLRQCFQIICNKKEKEKTWFESRKELSCSFPLNKVFNLLRRDLNWN